MLANVFTVNNIVLTIIVDILAQMDFNMYYVNPFNEVLGKNLRIAPIDSIITSGEISRAEVGCSTVA